MLSTNMDRLFVVGVLIEILRLLTTREDPLPEVQIDELEVIVA